MKPKLRSNCQLLIAAFVVLGALPIVIAQSPTHKETSMDTTKATGSFDVKTTPISAADAAVGRFAIDKQYHGDLEAVAAGEMLAVKTAVKGSACYVALE